MKDLNIRPKSIKLKEENTAKHLHDISVGNYSMDMTPKDKHICKWDYIKLQSFCTTKKTINTVKMQHIKFLQTINMVRDHFPKHKEVLQHNSKQQCPI